MNNISALFNAVYKLLNIRLNLFGYDFTLLQMTVFFFMLSVVIWIIGRVTQ